MEDGCECLFLTHKCPSSSLGFHKLHHSECNHTIYQQKEELHTQILAVQFSRRNGTSRPKVGELEVSNTGVGKQALNLLKFQQCRDDGGYDSYKNQKKVGHKTRKWLVTKTGTINYISGYSIKQTDKQSFDSRYLEVPKMYKNGQLSWLPEPKNG